MAAVKIPGVYKVTNNLNGKVYIGSSKDLIHRMKQYKWGSTSDKNYSETKRNVCIDMRKYGFENFTFDILESGEKFKDKEYRLLRETYYILKHDSTNPDKGYNLTRGGEFGIGSPRKQKPAEKNLRTDPIYVVYDNNLIMLYLGGAKTLSDETGHDRTVVTRAIRHGHHFENRMYLFYLDKDKRRETLEFVKNLKDNTTDNFTGYIAAYKYLSNNE